jgi:hypothetical protein
MSRETADVERNDALSGDQIRSRAELPPKRGPVCSTGSGYQLIGLVSIALIVAVYLFLQLNKLPNTSLSYSILNAVISLLFNFSSSALLKVFGFLISLFGLTKSCAFGERLP